MPRLARGLLAFVLGALCGAARAADIDSPRPDALAVTIYRDGPPPGRGLRRDAFFADRGLVFVTETRTLDLPAGRGRIRFEGVAEGINPQSAEISGLPGPLVERNFDYDLLSAGSLVAHAVGQQVAVVRTNPRTGRETRARAVVRSGPDGVVLDLGDHVEALHCDGAPERLVFDHVPPGLTARPTLSVVTDTPRAGRYQVRLSYLAAQLNWTADYIARVAPDGRSLDLTGWITLVNGGATGFTDAATAVVAGNLQRAFYTRPRPSSQSLRTACWPGQTTHSGWLARTPPAILRANIRPSRVPVVMLEAPAPPMAIAARAPPPPPPPVVEQRLGDYHLYALTNPTTVAARQTKQVMFLRAPNVRFEVIQAFVAGQTSTASVLRTSQVLRLKNTDAEGLGRGLPAGDVEVRRRATSNDGREILVGEAELDRDTPVGEPMELVLGADPDVTVRQSVETTPPMRYPWPARVTQTVTLRVSNAKAVPATVEIRHPRNWPKGFTVTSETEPHGFKSGDPLWRFVVPPGGTHDLTYAVTFSMR